MAPTPARPGKGATLMPDRIATVQGLLTARQNRRRATQLVAATAGSALLVQAGIDRAGPLAFARDDDPEEAAEEAAEAAQEAAEEAAEAAEEAAEKAAEAADETAGEGVALAQAPGGALEVRIVGDDAGDYVPGE